MGKNSARSKGYRKTYKKVTGYTETEKKIMIIGFAVLIIALLAVVVLPDAIAKIGSLKVKDDVVQGVGENWLLANTGTSSKQIYKKMAEVEPMEGYELAEAHDGLMDANLRYYSYQPVEGAEGPSYMVQPGSKDAAELIDYYRSMISSLGEVLYIDKANTEETINGVKTYSFVLEYRMEDYSEEVAAAEAEAEGKPVDEEAAEAEVNYIYTQTAVVYIESELKDKCVVVNMSYEGADETVFGDRAELHAMALEAAAGVTIGK